MNAAGRSFPWTWVGLAVLAGTLVWAFLHADYYLAPLAEQAIHPAHGILRSSGSVGLAFGLSATSLFVLNLLYLLRRRSVTSSWPGSLRTWMNLHAASGLVAAACVTLHSAAGLRSASGTVAALTLLVVVVSGLVGRYLYHHVPRTLEGREQEFEQVRAETDGVRLRLLGMGIPEAAVALSLESDRGPVAAFAVVLVGGPLRLRESREHLRRFREHGLAGPDLSAAHRTLKRGLKLRDSLTAYHLLRNMMASWRFLHRWLALVMVSAAACHVVVALRFAALHWPGVRS